MRTLLELAHAVALRVALVAVLTVAAAARARAELAEREPSAKAPALEYFTWTSRAGLKFAWRLPSDYRADEPRGLVLICHGTGLDHRWGPANHPAKSFRPHDIVVSPDGPTPANSSRLFLDGDVDAVATLLAELRERFAVSHVLLYGHSQGGFFVAHYAGERPGDVAGVVAHASGAWSHSRRTKASHAVAYSFLHGTSDPVVPFLQSVGARDEYVERGFPLVRLRRLQRYNHWPNAVRTSEELDWCDAMTTSDPARALECVERMLAPKPADEYQWTTAVPFAAAGAALRRWSGEGPAPFSEVDPKLQARAQSLTRALEAHASEHVAALRAALGKNTALALDGRAWLGHLVAAREDLRGLAPLESFVRELDYDSRRARQNGALRKLREVWYGAQPDAKKYEALVSELAEAYLCEGLPPELDAQLAAWRKDEKRLGASKKTSKGYDAVERWRSGWKDGLEAYGKLWKGWKLPAR